MELSKTADNLRFMANELKREHGENPKHETLVRIRTLENAIKELEGKRWIPVTERLPEDGTYLCTLDGELCGIEEPFTGMCGIENGMWDEPDCVIAWMPLPEPCHTSDF
ncbi:DUF551 domain-containing protein [[Clostridium] scindens]|uniref:DUF551 domain-containing protein n=1 Tax=Clostridium scindens (strain JCM 10418 / VPI 12708) TaxID=29347 RepID=UPI003AA8986F